MSTKEQEPPALPQWIEPIPDTFENIVRAIVTPRSERDLKIKSDQAEPVPSQPRP